MRYSIRYRYVLGQATLPRPCPKPELLDHKECFVSTQTFLTLTCFGSFTRGEYLSSQTHDQDIIRKEGYPPRGLTIFHKELTVPKSLSLTFINRIHPINMSSIDISEITFTAVNDVSSSWEILKATPDFDTVVAETLFRKIIELVFFGKKDPTAESDFPDKKDQNMNNPLFRIKS